MNGRIARWTIAIAGSLALHAGAVIWLGPGEDAIDVAGGASAEIAMLGNAFQDSLAAGATSETVEPVETESEAVPPVQPEAQSDAAPDPVQPAPPETAAQPVEQAQEPAATEPVDEAPTDRAREPPLQPAEPASRPEASEPQAAEPAEPIPGDIAIAALLPTEPSAVQYPSDSAAIEPVEEPDDPVTPQSAPCPTPRPEQVAAAPRREAQPREAPDRKEEQPKRTAAGAGGSAEQNARRGSADGSSQARQASSGVSGRSREAGNAAASNYPGKVYAKLRRSLRYPAEARRKRIRGEVHVRFTVSRSGGVGSVSVARSSGSSVLDGAAIDTVRRAAPFPEIPAAAGRSSWSFTVPLAFTR